MCTFLVNRAQDFSNYSDLPMGVVPGGQVSCVDQSERDVTYTIKDLVTKVWPAT